MRKILYILLFAMLFSACNEHKKEIAILKGYKNQSTVIYQTKKADFYIGFDDLVEYCEKEDNGEPNDFTYSQIIEYIKNYPDNPILIPDTLGTKLEKDREILFPEHDTLIRVRDQNHPYAYITDDVRWSIIEFAKKGKLRVYVNESHLFVDTVIINVIDTDWYGETNISLTNDSIVLSECRWIR